MSDQTERDYKLHIDAWGVYFVEKDEDGDTLYHGPFNIIKFIMDLEQGRLRYNKEQVDQVIEIEFIDTDQVEIA